MVAEAQTGTWVRWFVPILFVSLVGIFGSGVYSAISASNSASRERHAYQDEQIRRVQDENSYLRGIVSGLVVSVAALEQQLADHISTATRHINRIDKGEDRLNALERLPDARFDSFTGTQGAALERRLDAVEICCARSKQNGM